MLIHLALALSWLNSVNGIKCLSCSTTQRDPCWMDKSLDKGLDPDGKIGVESRECPSGDDYCYTYVEFQLDDDGKPMIPKPPPFRPGPGPQPDPYPPFEPGPVKPKGKTTETPFRPGPGPQPPEPYPPVEPGPVKPDPIRPGPGPQPPEPYPPVEPGPVIPDGKRKNPKRPNIERENKDWISQVRVDRGCCHISKTSSSSNSTNKKGSSVCLEGPAFQKSKILNHQVHMVLRCEKDDCNNLPYNEVDKSASGGVVPRHGSWTKNLLLYFYLPLLSMLGQIVYKGQF